MPTDGLRANNAYILLPEAGDPDTVTVIDPGFPGPRSRERIVEGLATVGAELGDIGHLLVTHAHRDHYPMAVHLRDEGVGRVGIGRPEQPSLDVLSRRQAGEPSPFLPLVRVAGADQRIIDFVAGMHAGVSASDFALPDDWIEPGTTLGAGGRDLIAIHTPGHTRGHFVFHDVGAGVMFTGDHVLPHITPSIGFEEVPPRSPLGDFLTSLRLLRAGPDAAMMPGHGAVGDSVHRRVDQLLAHHDRRLEESLAAIGAGAETAYEVARAILWTGRARRYGDLDEFNSTLALLETHWHLTLLAERGMVQAVDETGPEGVRRYHLEGAS